MPKAQHKRKTTNKTKNNSVGNESNKEAAKNDASPNSRMGEENSFAVDNPNTNKPTNQNTFLNALGLFKTSECGDKDAGAGNAEDNNPTKLDDILFIDLTLDSTEEDADQMGRDEKSDSHDGSSDIKFSIGDNNNRDSREGSCDSFNEENDFQNDDDYSNSINSINNSFNNNSINNNKPIGLSSPNHSGSVSAMGVLDLLKQRKCYNKRKNGLDIDLSSLLGQRILSYYGKRFPGSKLSHHNFDKYCQTTKVDQLRERGKAHFPVSWNKKNKILNHVHLYKFGHSDRREFRRVLQTGLIKPSR